MPTPEIQRLQRDIKELNQESFNAMQTREQLEALRNRISGLRQQVEKVRPGLPAAALDELTIQEKSLQDIERRIEAAMNTVPTESASQSPIEQAVQQTGEHVEGFLDRLGPSTRNFLRGFLASIPGLGWLSGMLDGFFHRFDIRREMKRQLPSQFVFADRRDGESVEALSKDYQDHLRSRSLRPDTFTFERFYGERIAALRQQYDRDRQTNPNLRPRYTIASLRSVQIPNAPGTTPNTTQNRPPEDPEERLTLRAELEMLHVDAIRLAFNRISGVNIAPQQNAPLPSFPGTAASATERRDAFRRRRDAITILITSYLENSRNRTPLYLQLRDGRLEEYEPVSFYGVWEWNREDDVIIPNFKTLLENDPIAAFDAIIACDPSRVSGIGHRAVRTFETIRGHLQAGTIQEGIRHPLARQLRNMPQAASATPQNAPAQSQVATNTQPTAAPAANPTPPATNGQG